MAIPRPFADTVELPAIFLLDERYVIARDKEDLENLPKDTAYEKIGDFESAADWGGAYTVYAPLGLDLLKRLP